MIGLVGYARSGKDTVGSILEEHGGYTPVAFADPIRGALYTLNPLVRDEGEVLPLQKLVDAKGWEWAKDTSEDVRVYLQRLGTDVVRQIDEDLWVNKGLATWTPRSVVTDVRFINEVEAICDRAMGECWFIERPGVGPANDHASEDLSALRHLCSRTIVNDGTVSDLESKVLAILLSQEYPGLKMKQDDVLIRTKLLDDAYQRLKKAQARHPKGIIQYPVQQNFGV